MKVTRDVIHDLLPTYLGGEATADTVALVEEYLRQDTQLASTVASLRSQTLPEPPPRLTATHEKETLDMTKHLLRWRGILMGLALFLTLLPLSFRFDNGRITWTFFQDAPPAATTVILIAAVVCWCSFLYVHRRLRSTGL